MTKAESITTAPRQKNIGPIFLPESPRRQINNASYCHLLLGEIITHNTTKNENREFRSEPPLFTRTKTQHG